MMKPAAVKVPQELLQVRRTTLEEYVQARMGQLASGLPPHFAPLLAPGVGPEALRQAVHRAMQDMAAPDYGHVPLEKLELQIVFRHECRALGCDRPHCALCQHSTDRRCTRNFDRKYLVDDFMVARCGAVIRIELVDCATGLTYEQDLPGVFLELIVLDGKSYDDKYKEEAARGAAARATDEDYDAIALLTNKKGGPLLVAMGGDSNDGAGRVILRPSKGRVTLPDLQMSESSEARITGRKPPVRLLVRAKRDDGRELAVIPAVSEDFVVATRRVKKDLKADIPSVVDHVSKIVHMGRETVKKLADLHYAAAQANMQVAIPDACARVERVGDLLSLVRLMEQDGHLRGQILALLKLPEEKWQLVRDHTLAAVVPDNYMRAWYPDINTMEVGLLFPCQLAKAELNNPAALLLRRAGADGDPAIDIIPAAQQTSEQREAVRQLQQRAEQDWWACGHAGWTLTTIDTTQFQKIRGKLTVSMTSSAADKPAFGTLQPQAAGPGGTPPGAAAAGGQQQGQQQEAGAATTSVAAWQQFQALPAAAGRPSESPAGCSDQLVAAAEAAALEHAQAQQSMLLHQQQQQQQQWLLPLPSVQQHQQVTGNKRPKSPSGHAAAAAIIHSSSMVEAETTPFGEQQQFQFEQDMHLMDDIVCIADSGATTAAAGAATGGAIPVTLTPPVDPTTPGGDQQLVTRDSLEVMLRGLDAMGDSGALTAMALLAPSFEAPPPARRQRLEGPAAGSHADGEGRRELPDDATDPVVGPLMGPQELQQQEDDDCFRCGSVVEWPSLKAAQGVQITTLAQAVEAAVQLQHMDGQLQHGLFADLLGSCGASSGHGGLSGCGGSQGGSCGAAAAGAGPGGSSGSCDQGGHRGLGTMEGLSMALHC